MLSIYLFRNKVKHKMNVKHVFVFTMCVVLPSGLYSNDKKPSTKHRNAHKLAKTWRKKYELYNPIQADDAGIVFMKIVVKPGARKNEIYVPEFDRIGVNITAQRYDESRANKELIEYLAEVLGLSKCDLKLVSGSRRQTKTLKLTEGLLTVKDVKEKLIKQLFEQIN